MTEAPSESTSDARQRATVARAKRIVWWLATASATAYAVLLISRLTGFEPSVLVWALAVLPLAIVGAPILSAAALWSRSWFAVGISIAALACGATWYGPMFVAQTRAQDQDSNSLTVATVNLKYGKADAAAIVEMVRDEKIDILGVEELTPSAVEDLADAGLGELLPHQFLESRKVAGGTGLYSALPLDQAGPVEGMRWAAVTASVTTASGPLQVYVVHPTSPGRHDHGPWARDFDVLTPVLASAPRPSLVAGDFNATLDHAPMRRILEQGFSDAAEQAGAGLIPTFPHGVLAYPLAPIDHVLASDGGPVATSVHSVTIDGTDHRALVVTYVLNGG